MSIHQSKTTDDSITLKTTATRVTLPPEHGDEHKTISQSKSETIGHRLCEFCEPRGTAHSNPDSVCECTPISRNAASRPIDTVFDLAMRIAEHAVLEEWSYDRPTDNVEIVRTHVGGGVSNADRTKKHDVKIHFNGMLWDEVTEPFTCKYGTAELWSIDGDGGIHIGVTLADEYARK